MSDIIKGLTVALKDGTKDEDARKIVDAISLIKGVVGVTVHVTGHEHHIARMQVRAEIMEKFMNIFKSFA